MHQESKPPVEGPVAASDPQTKGRAQGQVTWPHLISGAEGEGLRLLETRAGKRLSRPLMGLGLNPGTETAATAQVGGLAIARREIGLALNDWMAAKVLVKRGAT